MDSPRGKYVPPSAKLTAFSCPHCGTLTTQYWYEAYTDEADSETKLPFLYYPTENGTPFESMTAKGEPPLPEGVLEHWRAVAAGQIINGNTSSGKYVGYKLFNVHVSKCFSCSHCALWHRDKLIYPIRGTAPLPNPDLPPDVLADYEEADSILNQSPRGAAALLRLAIQKICWFLGHKGKKIDDAIAAMVAEGLPKPIQQALDTVRVVGNNAVHPGKIDLKDDVATAEKLFGLVNLIAQDRISNPKAVAEMYEQVVPESTRNAIDARDAKSKKDTDES